MDNEIATAVRCYGSSRSVDMGTAPSGAAERSQTALFRSSLWVSPYQSPTHAGPASTSLQWFPWTELRPRKAVKWPVDAVLKAAAYRTSPARHTTPLASRNHRDDPSPLACRRL